MNINLLYCLLSKCQKHFCHHSNKLKGFIFYFVCGFAFGFFSFVVWLSGFLKEKK